VSEAAAKPGNSSFCKTEGRGPLGRRTNDVKWDEKGSKRQKQAVGRRL